MEASHLSEMQAALVIDLAKALVELTRATNPHWQRAFWRFEADRSYYGSKGSFQTATAVQLFDPFRSSREFAQLNELGRKLSESVLSRGKEFVLLLLTVDSSFDYTIQFEYEDPGKWMINKMDGGTGIPVGIV